MKKGFLLATLCLFFCAIHNCGAQIGFRQYFDGADTALSNSLIIIRDTTTVRNIWQIGIPRKAKFNRAYSVPNVLVTDTANYYPVNDTSRFSFKFAVPSIGGSPVIAVRWVQKLDMEKKQDGGIVEFSRNGGAWQNIFNSPFVYNLYGFLQSNKDTLRSGQYAFSGTDTVWRDIWLCFRNLRLSDTISIRYTLFTDSNANMREGWMIDNMLVQRTFIHTVSGVPGDHDSKVYPTSTSGIFFVEAAHLSQQHVIKSIIITNESGRVVQQYHDEQQRFIIDIGSLPAGRYFVSVTSNMGKEVFPVLLHH